MFKILVLIARLLMCKGPPLLVVSSRCNPRRRLSKLEHFKRYFIYQFNINSNNDRPLRLNLISALISADETKIHMCFTCDTPLSQIFRSKDLYVDFNMFGAYIVNRWHQNKN